MTDTAYELLTGTLAVLFGLAIFVAVWTLSPPTDLHRPTITSPACPCDLCIAEVEAR